MADAAPTPRAFRAPSQASLPEPSPVIESRAATATTTGPFFLNGDDRGETPAPLVSPLADDGGKVADHDGGPPVLPGLDHDAGGLGRGAAADPDGPMYDYTQGTEGPDTLIGSEFGDYLFGRGGDDVIEGRGGDDTLEGGAGSDRIDGGDGNDRITQERDFASDRLTGGAGADFYVFNTVVPASGLGYVDVITDFSAGDGDVLSFSGNGGRISYPDGQYYRWNGALASPLATGALAPGGMAGFVDVWTWVSQGQTFLFVDLNDDSRLGSEDFLLAFDGAPTINLDSFRNDIFSVFFGTYGPDVWSGSRNEETYYGDVGDDQLSGLGGNDKLYGGYGSDLLFGGDGNDLLAGEAGNDILYGGDGDDTLWAGFSGNTSETDATSFNELYGEAGDDVLIGRQGRDYMDGGEGDDRITGNDAFDILIGGEGDDYLSPGDGQADGGEGIDTLVFGAGTGVLTGGSDADVFRLAIPDDGNYSDGAYALITDFSVAEGDRFDFSAFNRGSTRVVFRGDVHNAAFAPLPGATYSPDDFGPGFVQVWTRFDGSETLVMIDWDGDGVVSAEDYFFRLQGEVDLDATDFTTGSLFPLLGGTNGNDTWVGTAAGEIYYGLGGDDQIDGVAGYDELYGGGGNDIVRGGGRLYGGAGSDTLYGSDGWDLIYGDGPELADEDPASVNTIYGGGGNDSIRGGAGNSDQLYGGDGDDNITGSGFLYGEAGNDGIVGSGRLDGGDGNDYISSSGATPSLLLGGDGNDTLISGSGADILIGGAGNDTINGGNGYDIAGYSGVRRAYTASATSVSGNGEGVDTLTGIEDLAFTDGRLTFARDSQAAQVMRLYDAAFNRGPDQSGFEALLDTLENNSLTLSQLSTEFINSVEFQSQYAGLTNQQFVEQLYQFCLNRAGDSGGVATWTAALDGGMSRAEVLLAFSESSEHKDILQSQLDQGLWVADELTLQIARLYDATYDRLPDQGGLATWRNALGGGMALIDIAQAFATAPEFQARYGSLSNQAFVELMYQLCLDRDGDPEGIQTWVDALNGGMSRGEVLFNFSESSEHVALTRDDYLGGVQCVDVGGSSAPLTVPPADDGGKVADHDGGPLVLPGLDPDDGSTGVAAKGEDVTAPQVLPTADTDAGLTVRPMDGLTARGHEAVELSADPDAFIGDDAPTAPAPEVSPLEPVAKVADADVGPLVLPGLADDDFLLSKADLQTLHETGPQVLPAEEIDAGLSVDAVADALQIDGHMALLAPAADPHLLGPDPDQPFKHDGEHHHWG